MREEQEEIIQDKNDKDAEEILKKYTRTQCNRMIYFESQNKAINYKYKKSPIVTNIT